MTEKEKLLEIYKQTNYFISDLGIQIVIEKFNNKIDKEVEKFNKISWAFISASNPFSKNISDKKNEQNFELLKEQVSENYIKYFIGYGQGQGGWESEKSIFIIGITETQATKLGLLFGQNAIVIGSVGGTAKIKWLQD